MTTKTIHAQEKTNKGITITAYELQGSFYVESYNPQKRAPYTYTNVAKHNMYEVFERWVLANTGMPSDKNLPKKLIKKY